eukprot:2564422-Prymnesium_polylepis.1
MHRRDRRVLRRAHLGHVRRDAMHPADLVVDVARLEPVVRQRAVQRHPLPLRGSLKLSPRLALAADLLLELLDPLPPRLPIDLL